MKTRVRGWRRLRRPAQVGAAIAVLLGGGFGAFAIITNLGLIGQLHEPQAEHVDQADLLALVQAGEDEEAFEEAFEEGDELFETVFNALDGVGANVGKGERFTRVPRADLDGPGEWKRHTPARATGPNAQACNACHNQPFDDGAGTIASNVHRDPQQRGSLKRFIQRNTPHLFAPGAVQRLAEEMTADLKAIQAEAITEACAGPLLGSVTETLETKGVDFGTITAKRVLTGGTTCPTIPTRKFKLFTDSVEGVDTDLVIKPFQWKGSVRFIREFNRGASHNELGMQAVEIVGDGVDGDFDGVANEMTVGDQTALAVYLAAQPRATSKTELDDLGLLEPPLTDDEKTAIASGLTTFVSTGCDSCHRLVLPLDDPVFSEPSQSADYRDAVFPAGQNPVARGVDPAFPVTFDLTEDQPDNVLLNPNGSVRFRLGSLRTDSGTAIVELFGDLTRHDLGTGIAEQIDEVGTGASTFLTENLWGVGSTAPYMHDGRATTLTEAILEHGGEAAGSRSQFEALSTSSQQNLIAFLENLVLFKIEEEE
jgi:cytochrome c peroxidase